MLAKPMNSPSSWLPSSHRALCVTTHPSGTFRIFAKSIKKTRALGPSASATKSSELPTTSRTCSHGDDSTASRNDSNSRSICSTTAQCTAWSDVPGVWLGGRKLSRITVAISLMVVAALSSALGTETVPECWMPSMRKPSSDSLVTRSLKLIHRYLVQAFASRSSAVGALGSMATILLYKSGRNLPTETSSSVKLRMPSLQSMTWGPLTNDDSKFDSLMYCFGSAVEPVPPSSSPNPSKTSP
mmetsp:Transcript_59574/g.181909  ORF Transcript_59574/g.181909 Transcript_59574/m.181909 type:complete len:242 (+) Transcript_59574:114-839(+)